MNRTYYCMYKFTNVPEHCKADISSCAVYVEVCTTVYFLLLISRVVQMPLSPAWVLRHYWSLEMFHIHMRHIVAPACCSSASRPLTTLACSEDQQWKAHRSLSKTRHLNMVEEIYVSWWSSKLFYLGQKLLVASPNAIQRVIHKSLMKPLYWTVLTVRSPG